ncbi:uncharacterized protein LOC114357040 [Ostrinia furnacalis]|uniref:uncharacterized protein LOC114357040 n=1 Tax=Ostrinia furnacalis TaxID=93504 RepID=UPI00103AD71F|nr:uncharacterized protein LOC114357040 [Ostrinia furnacalis]
MHQNIASVLKKRDLIEMALQELQQKKNLNVQAICLSETFLKKGHESNIQFRDFKLAATYCRTNKKRGGTCILIKKNITDFKELQITKDLASQSSFECCGIEIINLKLIIICIYRVPNFGNVNVFYDKLTMLLHSIVKKNSNKKIVICGDWNIDMLKANKYSEELSSILKNHNMYLNINLATRRLACLDLIACNIKNAEGNIHYLALSDHETAQTLSFKTKCKAANDIPYWYEDHRDYSKHNIFKFRECIKALTFSDVYMKDNLDEAFKEFHDLFLLFYDLCFPFIRKKYSNRKVGLPWITKGIRKSCHKKRNLYLAYINSSNNRYDNRIRYKNYNRLLRSCLNKAQKLVNSHYINKSVNKCRAAWQVIKDNTNNNLPRENLEKIKKDNKIFTNPNDLCQVFNEYFIELTNKPPLNNSTNGSSNLHNSKRGHNSFYVTPTDTHEIIRIIGSLKNSKSFGYDGIRTDILKGVAQLISSPLSYLINMSFEQGLFPKQLKRSIINPIFKKGDRSDLNNYRPITLIPVISKVFEKAMFERLYNYITREKILKNEQFGFRKGFSTTLACFNLMKYVTESINDGVPLVAIFLDLSKAFDFVNHTKLLNKLHSYGIRGIANDWFTSYLSDRMQCTKINRLQNFYKKDFFSDCVINDTGVPQGSILGPILFLLYINDLPDTIRHKCLLYADDTTILIKADKTYDLETEINNTIKTLMTWLDSNNMKINIDKTNRIHFKTTQSRDIKLNIHYQNKSINEVETTKFLGVILDKHCTWKPHIDNVCNKLDRFVFVLKRLKYVSNNEAMMSAYYGYVSSILNYGIILWGNSVDSEKVFKIQKKCMRAMCGAGYRDSCKPLFKKLKILPLPCLYIKELCLFVKKHPDNFKTHEQVLEKTTRHKNRLYLPKINLTLYKRNVFCMAIRVFNKLPAYIQGASMPEFRNVLHKWLLDKCFYSVNEFF